MGTLTMRVWSSMTRKTQGNNTASLVRTLVGGLIGATAGYLVISALTGGSRTVSPPLRNDRPLKPSQSETTFTDVGGHADLKQQIEKRIIAPFRQPQLYERFGKSAGGGLLMYGPPGCGKTLLARATAGECKAQFFNIKISDVLDMYVGESERKLTTIFAQARAAAPSVLFFDELEGLAATRSARAASSIVSQFLTEMDGFAQNNRGVLILGATNVPWEVDSAFRRPGRFDRTLFVPPPDHAARVSILSVILGKRPLTPDVDFSAIAERTAGFSGADLKLLAEEATDAAITASLDAGLEVPISNDHLRAALGDLKPTTREWFAMAKDHARFGKGFDDVLKYITEHGLDEKSSKKKPVPVYAEILGSS